MTLQDDELKRIAQELATKLVDEANTKRVFKEALNEWLDHKYAAFGKWSAISVGASIFAALVVFIMWTQGYHK